MLLLTLLSLPETSTWEFGLGYRATVFRSFRASRWLRIQRCNIIDFLKQRILSRGTNQTKSDLCECQHANTSQTRMYLSNDSVINVYKVSRRKTRCVTSCEQWEKRPKNKMLFWRKKRWSRQKKKAEVGSSCLVVWCMCKVLKMYSQHRAENIKTQKMVQCSKAAERLHVGLHVKFDSHQAPHHCFSSSLFCLGTTNTVVGEP